MGKWKNRRTFANTMSTPNRQNTAVNYKSNEFYTIGATNWLNSNNFDENSFDDFYTFLLKSKRSVRYVIQLAKEKYPNDIELNSISSIRGVHEREDKYLSPFGKVHELHYELFENKNHPIWKDQITTDLNVDNLVDQYINSGKEIKKIPPTNRRIKGKK